MWDFMATQRFFYPKLENGWRVGVGRAEVRSRWRSQNLIEPKKESQWVTSTKGAEASTEHTLGKARIREVR